MPRFECEENTMDSRRGAGETAEKEKEQQEEDLIASLIAQFAIDQHASGATCVSSLAELEAQPKVR